MVLATPLQYAPPSRRRRLVLFALAAVSGAALAWLTPDGAEPAIAVITVGLLALITGVLSSWSP